MSLITPTSLTDQQVREFQFLYWNHYKIQLTYAEAYEKGVNFLQFMTIIINGNEKFFDD